MLSRLEPPYLGPSYLEPSCSRETGSWLLRSSWFPRDKSPSAQGLVTPYGTVLPCRPTTAGTGRRTCGRRRGSRAEGGREEPVARGRSGVWSGSASGSGTFDQPPRWFEVPGVDPSWLRQDRRSLPECPLPGTRAPPLFWLRPMRMGQSPLYPQGFFPGLGTDQEMAPVEKATCPESG